MSWNPKYIVLIMISTVVDYLVALRLGATDKTSIKKVLLAISLFVNLGLLFTFKYFNFFGTSITQFFAQFGINFHVPILQFLLPVGISFYTFQTIGYTIDVYNGKIKPEKHLGIFAVYVSIFPQLVAGPIERAKSLLPQFYEQIRFNYSKITDGLKLMLWGFFKKIVIADRLAILVNTVYSDPTQYTGTPLILATVFFAFQIYCDFSGYSDIAIGAAQVMGIRLMDNFKRPYHSRSISEFWNRWHISLSTWFRDYVYTPMIGSKIYIPRWYFSMFITFVISGIWHGANWTFVVWGALHGFYLVASLMLQPMRSKYETFLKVERYPKLYALFQMFGTFLLVCFGWIFFRANSVSDALYIITNLHKNISLNIFSYSLGLESHEILIAFGLLLFMELVHLIQSQVKIRAFLNDKPLVLRWTAYIIIILLIAMFAVTEKVQFIYFQF